MDVINQEGVRNNSYYIIWLNNLFTSASLLTELNKEGFSGASTIRISKTAREEDEEISGTIKQRQRAKKEQNWGLDRCLSKLKIHYTLQVL